MNKKSILANILDYFVIISFIMNEFANTIAFYLTGNASEALRKVISWSIMLCVTIILGIWLLNKIFKEKQLAKKLLICLVPVIVNGAVLVFALILSRGKTMIIREFASFIVYCVPLACAAIYMLVEKRFWEIIIKVKYLALFMMPFYVRAVIYFWGLTPLTDLGDGYGGIGYLGIGYSASIIYSFLICDLLWMYSNDSSVKSNHSNEYKCKRELGLMLIEVVVCTVVIISSGSRGVLLSWAAISIVAYVLMLIKRERKAISGILISVITLVTFFVIAPSDNAAISRQLSLINEVKQGNIRNAFVSEEKDHILDEFEQQANGIQGMKDVAQNLLSNINENVNDIKEGEKVTDGDKSEIGIENNGERADIDEEYQKAIYSITNGSAARAYLFQLALREAKNRPFTGMGIMGYQQKYGTYPHNIILEVLADFGVPLCIAFMLLLIAMSWHIIKYSKNNWKYVVLLVILSGQMVKYLLSGDIYVCPILIFASVIVMGERFLKPDNIIIKEI